nr:class I adenylate-forming enzyme family protein [uncultured Methanolobus sp.]
MLEMNKMKDKIDIGSTLKHIFMSNWEDYFLYDAINGNNYTYNSFFNSVVQYQTILKNKGIKKGDIICLLLSNSIELPILYFTSLIMQLTVVPIDTKKGYDEIKEILAQLGYKMVLHDNDVLVNDIATLVDTKTLANEYSSKIEIAVEDLSIFENIDYNKPFLITFTSGSTGSAKGVVHSFRNLYLSAYYFNEGFNFDKNNIFYNNLPMTYMAGILNLFILPFICESKIVIDERFSISKIMRFWENPIKYSVNTFWFIPTILNLLLKLDRGNQGIEYSNKRNIIGCVGTAPLSNKTKLDFSKKYNIQLFESYGLSETLFISTNSPGKPQKSSSVGNLLHGINLDFCPDNEIAVDVPWMFLGYTNQETQNYFKNGKYLTGDLGIIDENGFLSITGRKKDIIIRGGINLSPKKIEGIIESIDVFEDYVIIGLEDENLGEKTACFFVPSYEDYKNILKKINKELVEKLGEAYHIDEFVRMNEIPKNINGKIDKIAIKKMYEGK